MIFADGGKPRRFGVLVREIGLSRRGVGLAGDHAVHRVRTGRTRSSNRD